MTQLSSGRSSFDAFLDRHMLRHALRAWIIAMVVLAVSYTAAALVFK